MQTKVYNLAGQEVSALELADSVFGVKIKPAIVHEVFVAQMNKAREPWADTKKRGEVRGGGKKPWAQKGTGRARHGSIRSPIWKGGGVVFGPRTERNYKVKVNKATRRLAIRMCLSDKAGHGALYVLADFAFAEPKTKVFAALLRQLPGATAHSWLVLTPGKNDAVLQMTHNLPRVDTARAEDVTVSDLVNHQAVLTSVAGVKTITAILAKPRAD